MMGSMNDRREETENKIGANLSKFLNDFAPRPISDSDIEILPPEEPQPIVMSEPVVEFTHDDNEDMVPFEEKGDHEEPQIDTEEIVKHAVDEAVEKTKSELQAQYSSEKQLLQEQHQKEIENTKEATIKEMAANLSNDLTTAFDSLMQDVSNDVGKILSVFIADRLTDEAIKEFSKRLVSEAISGEEPLILEGNAQLLSALQNEPNFDKAKYDIRPTASADIRLRRGDSVIATRLEPLLSELKELVK